MDPRELLAALFTTPDGQAAIPQAAAPSAQAGMQDMSGSPLVNAPMPPDRPENLPLGPSAPAAAATPPGQVLARLPKKTGASPFSAGMAGGLGNLQRTPDPWMAFAQGFGGAMKGRDKYETDERASAAKQLSELFKIKQQAFKDQREEKRLDADISAKKEANSIARERVQAYRDVGGGKASSGDDADYKRAVTRKNLLGELKDYRTELGLTRDDEETLPSRKMSPDERKRREEMYQQKEKEIRGMMPRAGQRPRSEPADDEEDPAPAAKPQAQAPAAAPKASGRKLPDGMTPDVARENAKAAIEAGRDRDQVLKRLEEFGITTDGL